MCPCHVEGNAVTDCELHGLLSGLVHVDVWSAARSDRVQHSLGIRTELRSSENEPLNGIAHPNGGGEGGGPNGGSDRGVRTGGALRGGVGGGDGGYSRIGCGRGAVGGGEGCPKSTGGGELGGCERGGER